QSRLTRIAHIGRSLCQVIQNDICVSEAPRAASVGFKLSHQRQDAGKARSGGRGPANPEKHRIRDRARGPLVGLAFHIEAETILRRVAAACLSDWVESSSRSIAREQRNVR